MGTQSAEDSQVFDQANLPRDGSVAQIDTLRGSCTRDPAEEKSSRGYKGSGSTREIQNAPASRGDGASTPATACAAASVSHGKKMLLPFAARLSRNKCLFYQIQPAVDETELVQQRRHPASAVKSSGEKAAMPANLFWNVRR